MPKKRAHLCKVRLLSWKGDLVGQFYIFASPAPPLWMASAPSLTVPKTICLFADLLDLPHLFQPPYSCIFFHFWAFPLSSLVLLPPRGFLWPIMSSLLNCYVLLRYLILKEALSNSIEDFQQLLVCEELIPELVPYSTQFYEWKLRHDFLLVCSGAHFLLVSGLGDPNTLSLHAWGLHADVWLVSLLFFSMFASAWDFLKWKFGTEGQDWKLVAVT